MFNLKIQNRNGATDGFLFRHLRYSVMARLIVLFCMVFAGCSEDNNPDPDQDPDQSDELAANLEEIAAREQLPSLVVGIIDGEEFSETIVYGLADRASELPATEGTIYYLASISKVFTAVAVMQLVENDLLDLDEDISNYLPFEVFNPHYPGVAVTTRMLLGHRAGLSEKNYSVFPEETAPPMFPAIQHILTPGHARYEPDIWRNVRPGSDFQYSNVTTAILGYLVEVVSGMDYNEYAKSNIFVPLGMTQTSHDLKDLPRAKMARPYVNNSPVQYYSVEFYPSGMLKSSLNDLGKFVSLMLNKGIVNGVRILSEESVDQILTLHNADSPVGYIFYKYTSLGGVWGHAGWFRGFQTMLFFEPSVKKGAIILANSSTPPNNPILFNGEITKLVQKEIFK